LKTVKAGNLKYSNEYFKLPAFYFNGVFLVLLFATETIPEVHRSMNLLQNGYEKLGRKKEKCYNYKWNIKL